MLKFGYRYIEIDIWVFLFNSKLIITLKDGPYGDPGLFHESNGAYVPCEAVLEAIANYGFESNSYPLIIGLNL